VIWESKEYHQKLRIRHSMSHTIECKLARPAPGTRDLLRTQSILLRRGDRVSNRASSRSAFGDRIVIFDCKQARAAAGIPSHNYLGVSLVSSVHHGELDQLNTEFRQNGYGTVSSIQHYLGFAFDGGLGAFRAAGDFQFGLERAGGDRAPYVDQALLALHTGVTLLAGGRWSLFPMVGISGGDLGVRVNPDQPALLADQLQGRKDERVRRNLTMLFASLGADYRLPLTTTQGGLLVAPRIGYGWQVVQTRWLSDEPAAPNFRGGPRIDTSGPYVRLAVGWYVE
jgi:hypothetical protein